MHEKTLLYSALGVTALATIFGVLHAKADSGPARMDIAPVSLVDSSNTVATAEVPIRLTASDGTGLKLVALKAEAAVEDPLALTELHLTFENPQNRVLEGTFRITLPQGASLSRFAMKVGNTWQEGEVVEKQAARQAYEDFLHRRQDPALMEQGAGNEFSARVFPIPANGTKEIIITYSENVAIGAPYVLPLRGLPQLGVLDVNVHVTGKSAASDGKTDALYGVHQTKFTPASDFVVESKQLPRSPGLRAGNLAIARVIPFAQSRPDPVNSAVILVDTSASRGLGIAEQARVVKDMIAKLPGDAEITVGCFDQDVVSVYEGKASGFGQKEVSAITLRGALGASNFEGAMAWAGTEAKKKKASRIVWVTDGVATAGETDGQKMKDKVEALREAGVTRMDAVAMGGIRDDAFLRTVVRGVLDKDGVVLDAKIGAEAVARRLGEMTSSGIPVKVEGAKWSYPQQLDGLQAGDEVLVFAEMDAGSVQPKILIGNQPFNPDLRTIERPLVERAWAQAKIQSLLDQPKENAAATKNEIIHLSTTHRVLSPYTALLVLETDWDYRRFNIDRTAKVDILTVEGGKVAVTESGRVSGEEVRKQAFDTETRTRAKGKAEKKTSAPTAAAEVAPADGVVAAAPSMAATATASPPMPAPAQGRRDEADLDRAATSDPGTVGGLGASAGGGGSPSAGAAHFIEREAASPARRLQPGPGGDAPPPPAAEPMASAASGHRGAPRPITPAPADAFGEDSAGAASDQRTGVRGQVRPTTLTVDRGISQEEVQRVIRGAVVRYRQCYQVGLNSDPRMHGTIAVQTRVDQLGAVTSATATTTSGDISPSVRACIEGVTKRMQFPAPGTGDATFTQSLDLVGGGENTLDTNTTSANGNVPKALPYEGRFKTVMESLASGAKDAALDEANRWHADQPGDILSLVALGEVFEARGELDQAARAYGSILELFSFRADSRRFAGERLERLQNAKALALAADTYGKAVEQRPDHPASHRLYAYTLLKKGEHEKAFEAIKAGATRTYPSGRFRGVDRILKEDMGLIAAAWMKAQPARRAEITQKLHAAGGTDENNPSLRFVLVWETDANDVDFHIHDGKGGHAFYSQKELPSGGELYADVTTGYGPECFTIRNPHARSAYPYTLQAHYYSRGPMGYGMGKMEILEHDGKGGLSFTERPFVVMVDRAYVDMGTVDKNTKLTPM